VNDVEESLYNNGGKRMKKLRIFLACSVTLVFLVSCFLAHPAHAIPGDVNDNGVVESGDLVYLVNYLFLPGYPPPPNPIDADIDGSPGINLGDVLQLSGYLFLSGCELLPYTGASVEVGSHIRFSSTVIPPDTILGTTVTVPVKIIENEGPDLTGMVVPISYASEPGEVEVTLDSLTFTETIPSGWYTYQNIDNPNKRVVFAAYAPGVSPVPIDSGTIGTVAELHFTRVSLDSLPLVMSSTQMPPSHSFMLISEYCADTTFGGTSPSERIFTPKLSLARAGDCNGDGEVDVGDVMYLINHLFLGTSPPVGLK
jgi:hypothetical protein